MIENLDLLSVPAIILVVQAVKLMGLPSQLAPILAVITGYGFGYLMHDPIEGLLFGLTASGLYSGAKAILKQ